MGARRSRWVRLRLLAIWRSLLGCLGSALSTLPCLDFALCQKAVAVTSARWADALRAGHAANLAWNFLQVGFVAAKLAASSSAANWRCAEWRIAHAAPPCLAWAARTARAN